MTVLLAELDRVISQAVAAVPAIVALGADRVAWADIMSDPPRPCVFIDHVPTEWTDRTVTGGDTVAAGYVDATIIFAYSASANSPAVVANSPRNAANLLADQIIAAFPKGRRIALSTGAIVISAPTRPVARAGFRDGADWRLPLRIDYRTETP